MDPPNDLSVERVAVEDQTSPTARPLPAQAAPPPPAPALQCPSLQLPSLQVRAYVDPLWISRTEAVMPRFLLAVPVARAYGTGTCMLLDGTQAYTEHLPRGAQGYLTDQERTLARHRALAAEVTLRPKGPLQQQRVIAVHVPTWDWDCAGGDVSLFVQQINSFRGRTLLQRQGPSCMLSPYAVIDEQALEADAAEIVALALEAASTEALLRGKQAIVKLPTLGAAPHLRTSTGLLVGPYAYRSFWRGVRLALTRCLFPGIAVLECSDKLGASNLAPEGLLHVGGLTVVVPEEARDIADFSGASDDLLRCIIVPGSSFQMAGGLASFHLTLESALAGASDLSLHLSPIFNKSLVAQAQHAMPAQQPASARPHWWPPQALRRAFNI